MSAFVIVLIILLAIKYLPGLLSEVFLGPSGIFLWMMVSVVAVAFICIFIDKKIKLHNSRRKRNWSKNKNRRDYKVDHKKIKQDMINHKLEEEKKGLEKERERNISIVESDPPTPVLIEISTNTDFSCKEEEKINIHLRKYSHLKNQINETESMLNYLKQKYAALTALGRQEEAQNVEIELNSQETTLREYQMYENTDSYIFKSELNDIFFNDNEIRDYYCKFIQAIGPRVSFSTYMSDFFSEDYMYMINVEGIMICLTPCYIVCFEPKLYHDKPIEL
mgnify:CR=1 FL=1